MSKILATFVIIRFTYMNKRLLQFLTAENITQAQFADKINVARASISHIIAGRNKPGFDFIESMALHYPELNIEWLITGKGRMYKSMNQELEAHEDVAEPPVDEEIGRDAGAVVAENSCSEAAETKSRKIVKVIVLFDDNTFEELN